MADQETGIVLLVLGVILMVVGIFFWPICAVGIILLIVGIILIAAAPSHPAYPMYYAPPPGYPYAAPPPTGPAPPAGTAPSPTGAPSVPLCPVCSGPLTWVTQYQRWYCYRCQAYR